MTQPADFDLRDFLPYLLTMAAEQSSHGFQTFYRERFGMLRTEWRVLVHLGRYGEMTAKEICDRSRIHKTKISRAVAKLEEKRFIRRTTAASDRRLEILKLTSQGKTAYTELCKAAQDYDAGLRKQLSEEETQLLRQTLMKLGKI